VGITGLEAISGFIVGNILGMVMGIGLAFFPLAQRIAKPYMTVVGAIPVFALAPMMIMWFGVGCMAKAFLAMLSTLLIAITNAYEGAVQTDPNLIAMSRSFGASRFQIFRLLVLPSAVSWLISSLRMSIGFALLGAFIGELISADRGLGYAIMKAGGLYDIPRVLAGVVLMVTLALLQTFVVDCVSRRLLRWRVTGQPQGLA
jgi:NitT/TauT family transport system permease protein